MTSSPSPLPDMLGRRPRDAARIATYQLPTSIVLGAGAVDRLPGELAALGVDRPLLVTDPGVRAGPAQRVIDVLTAAGYAPGVFDAVEADPLTTTAEAIGRALTDGEHDGAVGVGGGSALDAAKAGAVVAATGLPARELAGPDRVPADPLPVVAVPTTAGSGSEVTRFAVLTDPDAGRKVSLASMRIMPRVAVLDPALTVSLPPALTAASGVDALAHAVESYGSVWNQPISEGMALYAVELVGRHLRTAVSHPEDLEARAGMLSAACIAELAANSTRLGLTHALAIPLGALHGVPHGVAVATFLAAMCAYNEPAVPERNARLVSSLTPGNPGTELATAVTALVEEVGLTRRLRDFGVTPADHPRVVEQAQTSDNVQANPRIAEAEDLAGLLQAVQ